MTTADRSRSPDRPPSEHHPPILLIDPHRLLRSSIRRILAAGEYPVRPATRCDRALARLEGGLRPGLILLNLHAPGAIDFRHRQLGDPRLHAIPLIGYASYEAHFVMPFLSLTAYLQMPMQIDLLLDTVRTHYQAHER